MSEFNHLLKERQAAPVIVASGMGYMAERMVEVALENGVPVYEDNSLATMLTQLELGAEVPEELYQAIVDIYVYFLNYAPKQVPGHEEGQEEQEGPQEEQGPAVGEGGQEG